MVVGVDLVDTHVPQLAFVQGDVNELSSEAFIDALGGPADLVLCDMAPRTTGNLLGDHVAQLELAQRALIVAREVLGQGGGLVVKVFDGEDANAFVRSVRPHFGKVKRVRPEAVRKNSREFFLVCMERRQATS